MNRKIAGTILATLLFAMPLVLISCGMLDDNTQPTLDSISDNTLDVGGERWVGVYITDADVDDTHTINASSENPRVATVTVDEDSLTITGNAVGMTTIKITATDNSGQDNNTSLPVTFKVTVNEPPPPPINKGLCVVGMRLQPGEGCTYIANEGPVFFYVDEHKWGCRTIEQPIAYNPSENINIHVRGITAICEFDRIRVPSLYNYNFSANKNRDGSWTISRVP